MIEELTYCAYCTQSSLVSRQLPNASLCVLYSSSCVALTKSQRLGGLHNRHLLPTTIKAGKFKIRAQVDPLSNEDPFAGLQIDIILCLHTEGARKGQMSVCPHLRSHPHMKGT